MKYLDEMFAFVITNNNIYFAFMNTDLNFRDHCDALKYLYNEKINKGFFKKKIDSRDKDLYKYIITNKNNVLFLNETKGGKTLRGFLYIPKEIMNKQYEILNYYSDALSNFELIVVYDNNKQDIIKNSFDINNYINVNRKKF